MAGRGWTGFGLLVAAVLLVMGGVFLVSSDDSKPPTGAQDGGASLSASASPVGGPCAFREISPEKYGGQPLQNPPEVRSVNGRLRTTITAGYTDPDNVSLGGCGLRVRSYNGRLTGPTLRLKPGDTLNLRLLNGLPKQSIADIQKQFEQQASKAHIVHTPVPFNTTNVHYHGLHVSPNDNGDNVYLEIEPGQKEDYELELRPDHPVGTYWYHAHAHGSTAIQVASGMAGALIIEDDPNKIPAALRAANEREKVMLFQSILYDTKGELEQFQALFPGPNPDPECEKGSSLCHWQGSQRRTTINGQIVPKIYMRPGEVQRWRLIDGTFAESLFLQLEEHSLNEIALDGNYLGSIDSWGPKQAIQLEPGYRSDVLVQAKALPPGVTTKTYDLVDLRSPPKQSLRGEAEPPQLLAQVVVSGAPMGMALPTDSQMAPLAPFQELGNLADKATGIQTVLFKLGHDAQATSRLYFTVNYAAFSPNHVRTLFLNDIDEWRIGTVGDDDGFPIPTPIPTGRPTPTPSPTRAPPPFFPAFKHIFHIHVNPFQVMRTDPDGKPEMVWKDTLAVDGNPVSIYTKYTDYTGEFVIHCHILDHEDLGMMEAVEIIREDSLKPTPTPLHAH